MPMYSEIGKGFKENFYGEYRKGVLRKKYSISLIVYETYLIGTGFRVFDKELTEEAFTFNTDLKNIKKISSTKIKGDEMLQLEYYGNSLIVERIECTVVFPGIKEIEKIIQLVTELKEKVDKKSLEELRSEQEEKQKKEQVIRRTEKEAKQFFDACYQFHILNEQRPFYELHRSEVTFAGIYLDQDRNLNFLKIDGRNQEEMNTMIVFDHIHYYERAGAIHYVAETHGGYKSFGGSISGATFSEATALLGGLLFGSMGMIGGALLSYQPSRMTFPTTTFKIDSAEKQIDDRSVILNYYSDQKKQYIDIELPANSYNFLQTYLPEKKYGIVSELEKRSAIHQFSDQIERGEYLTAPSEYKKIEQNAKTERIEDTMDTFERKVKKLKIMLDNGVLTQEEFEVEKRRLLDEL